MYVKKKTNFQVIAGYTTAETSLDVGVFIEKDNVI